VINKEKKKKRINFIGIKREKEDHKKSVRIKKRSECGDPHKRISRSV